MLRQTDYLCSVNNKCTEAPPGAVDASDEKENVSDVDHTYD